MLNQKEETHVLANGVKMRVMGLLRGEQFPYEGDGYAAYALVVLEADGYSDGCVLHEKMRFESRYHDFLVGKGCHSSRWDNWHGILAPQHEPSRYRDLGMGESWGFSHMPPHNMMDKAVGEGWVYAYAIMTGKSKTEAVEKAFAEAEDHASRIRDMVQKRVDALAAGDC